MSENTVNWLVENHIILNKMYDLDATSLAKHMTEANNLLNTSDLPLIHTVWDMLDATYPSKINDIRDAIKPLFTNERLGWVIVVSDKALISFLTQFGSSMYGVRYRKLATVDHAMAFLQERDRTVSLPR